MSIWKQRGGYREDEREVTGVVQELHRRIRPYGSGV